MIYKCILLTLLFCVGCGSTNNSPAITKDVLIPDDGSGTTPMTSVSTVSNLPVCDGENLDQVIYVRDENKFYNCYNGTWDAIHTGNVVISDTRCMGTSPLLTISIIFSYSIVEFNSGDKLISCQITDPNGKSMHNTTYYRASQVGAATEVCIVDYDVEGSGFGYWKFEKNNDPSYDPYHMKYTEVGSASDGLIINFELNECTKTN